MGGLKNGKNGGDPYGFCLIFGMLIVKCFSLFNSTFKLLTVVPGDFLFDSALFIHSPCQTSSQPMSGQ